MIMVTPRLSASDAAAPATWSVSAAELRAITGGSFTGTASAVELCGACIDSRHVNRGAIFACLKGERHDGHDHAAAAIAAGAGLVLASRAVDAPAGASVLVVADVVAALGALATAFRRRHAARLWVGVTGSSGKTTVKELLAAGLGAGAPTHATQGNLNNHLGVPLSVLATPANAQRVVIEMGANHQHEISGLASIAQPTMGVITTIGLAHLEGFGGMLGIASGKAELFAALGAQAPCVYGRWGIEEAARLAQIPVSAVLEVLHQRAGGRQLIEVGSGAAPIEGHIEDDGRVVLHHAGKRVRLGLYGEHNLANAALALHACLVAGAEVGSVLRGLASVEAIAGRLRLITAGVHRLWDDSYNANPVSMLAAARQLQRAAASGPVLAVLGGMGELGNDGPRLHRALGSEIAALGLQLICVGPAAAPIAEGYRGAGTQPAACAEAVSIADAAALVRERVGAQPHTVLVKASRFVGLDALVAQLAAGWKAEGACSSG